MESLPPSKVCSIIFEPCPTSPSRFSLGTLTSSKKSSEVSLARHIILPCMGIALKPGVPFSTITVENIFLPFSSPETACTVQPFEISEEPLVINIFDPLITHSSPSRTAVVFEPRESEPAPGSVRPKLHRPSPVQSCGKYFCFCSSVPKA